MTIFHYAAREEQLFENALKESGYERQYTFFNDLSIAECCGGEDAIKDTYERVCKEWLSNYKAFTEFVLSLNHKSWAMHARGNEKLCKLYCDLYYAACDLFHERYGNDEEAEAYYFRVTD